MTINTNTLRTTGPLMDFGKFGKKNCVEIIFETLNIIKLLTFCYNPPIDYL